MLNTDEKCDVITVLVLKVQQRLAVNILLPQEKVPSSTHRYPIYNLGLYRYVSAMV